MLPQLAKFSCHKQGVNVNSLKGRCVLSREGLSGSLCQFSSGIYALWSSCQGSLLRCGKWGFLAEHNHSNNTLRASVDFIIFLQQPYKRYKIHTGHFFSPPSPESNTGDILCCSRGGGGSVLASNAFRSADRQKQTNHLKYLKQTNRKSLLVESVLCFLSFSSSNKPHGLISECLRCEQVDLLTFGCGGISRADDRLTWGLPFELRCQKLKRNSVSLNRG